LFILVTRDMQLHASRVIKRLGPTLQSVLAKKYGKGSNYFCRKLLRSNDVWLPNVKAAICIVIIALYIMM